MKRIFLTLLLLVLSTGLQAQKLNKYIPSDAIFVMKWNGANINQKIQMNELDRFQFMKELLHPEFGDNLSSSGINFDEDAYHYYYDNDSLSTYCIMVPLKSEKDFEKFLLSKQEKDYKVAKEKNFNYLDTTHDINVFWNNKFAVFVMGDYDEPYHYDYETEAVAEAEWDAEYDEVAVEEAIEAAQEAVEEAAEYEYDPYQYYDYGDLTEEAAMHAKESALLTEKAVEKIEEDELELSDELIQATKKAQKEAKESEEATEALDNMRIETAPVIVEIKINDDAEVEEEREEYTDEAYDYAEVEAVPYEEETYDWEAEYEEEQRERNKLFKSMLLTHMKMIFDKDMDDFRKKEKSLEKWNDQAEINFWFDQAAYTKHDLGDIAYYYPRGFSTMLLGLIDDFSYDLTANLIFDQREVKLEAFQKMKKEAFNAAYKKMYSTKMPADMLKFVGPSPMAAIGVSMDTEATFDIYNVAVDEFLKSEALNEDIQQELDLSKNDIEFYRELISIFLDEEAIAKIIPGDALAVFHQIDTKEITYTDYDYDDDYNYFEVEKTKEEMVPYFTFAFRTEQVKLLEKMLKLPMGKRHMEKYKFDENGKFYFIDLGDEDDIFEKIFLKIQNDVVYITNYSNVLNALIKNKPQPMLKSIEQKFLNNSQYGFIDSEQMMNRLTELKPNELMDADSFKFLNYFKENLGDMEVKSNYEKGYIKSEYLYQVKGNAENGLQGMFDFIEGIYLLNQEKSPSNTL